MKVRTRVRPGVYFDELNMARECVLVEVQTRDRWRVVSALDTRTRERILDPPEALPMHRDES